MNPSNNIPNANGSHSPASADATLKDLDSTLRLLAKLPIPAGMEDRVFAGVLASPRKAKVLEWPQPLHARDWVRSVAAAAIVLAVGSGGWSIYAHVEQNQPASGIVATRPVFPAGGFSSADMIRRPQTLNGPIVKKPETVTAEKPAAKLTSAQKPSRTIARQHPVKAKPVQTRSAVAR
ncbi:MAG TPA: hypothetical protein VGR47_03375 [Terracidiphilus sp.]|nr:hypothetical protein [Terracidiphilus sp.]